MQLCRDHYLGSHDFENQKVPLSVLDIGGTNASGNYCDLFKPPYFNYQTADMSPGPGIDLVLEIPGILPLKDASIDIVISGRAIQRDGAFRELFADMLRVTRPPGFIFLIMPSAGPADSYHFHPGAYRELAEYTKCYFIGQWLDERGPWCDLVGVFSRTEPSGSGHDQQEFHFPDLLEQPEPGKIPQGSPDEELMQGAVDYRSVLQVAHDLLQPKYYIEIGIRNGASLSLARGKSLGIDPAPEITHQLNSNTMVCEQTSDNYFRSKPIFDTKPDFAFIDGMHLFEYALRDFMNLERIMNPAGLIVIDDIYPNHPLQASRRRKTRVWTGDIWRLYRCLKQIRGDLWIFPLNTAPTGLLLIAGLDADNSTLWERYNPIVNEAQMNPEEDVPVEMLQRMDAYAPQDLLVNDLLLLLSRLKQEGGDKNRVRAALGELLARVKKS